MCATRGPPYAGAEQCREEVLVAVAALVPDRPVVALKPAWAAVVGDADNQRPAVRVEEAGDGLTTASSIAASRCFVWRLSRAVDLNSTLRFSPAAMSSAVGTLDGPALSPLPVTSLGGPLTPRRRRPLPAVQRPQRDTRDPMTSRRPLSPTSRSDTGCELTQLLLDSPAALHRPFEVLTQFRPVHSPSGRRS
jgi:hypothetical protein